uniref:Uncharacterized protein n=1 Tax=Ditylenchus dipsaci TaxID=166011 RepID=A0A915CV86_9BILA
MSSFCCAFSKQSRKIGFCFTIHDVLRDTEPKNAVMFLFLSDVGLRLLRSEINLPCFYTLLPVKSEGTYTRMFQTSKNVAGFFVRSRLMQISRLCCPCECPAQKPALLFGQVKVSYCLLRLCENDFAHIQWKSLNKLMKIKGPSSHLARFARIGNLTQKRKERKKEDVALFENDPVEKVRVKRLGISLTKRDLHRFELEQWLDDQAINFYIQLVHRSQFEQT